MKKVVSMVLCLAITAGILSGCGNQASSEPSSAPAQSQPVQNEPSAPPSEEVSNYPVTIENNGNTLTYEAAPERVVVLSYEVAEIMAALGLEDRVVALAPGMNQLDEVKEEYRDAISQMPVFDEASMTNGVPNLETVLSVEPDFVYGSYFSFFAFNCGEAADYLANSINIYAQDTTYTANAGLNELYTQILNIGKIFDVCEKAEELVNDLKAREQAVIEKVQGLDTPTVFVFAHDLGDGTYRSTGGANFVDSLILSAGGKCVFEDVGKSNINVTPEEIIARDPEYVLTISYYTADDGQNKIDFMKNSADFTDLQAVKNDNFLALGGLVIGASAGLQSLDGLEAIAAFLHPEAFEH